MRELVIGRNEAGQRFDKYLFKLLKNAGTGLVYKQLRGKNITLNGAKAKGNEILALNDTVRIFMSDDTIDKFMGADVRADVKDTLKVIYEDEDIIIADKPSGFLSQKSKPQDVSMNEILIAHMRAGGMDDRDLAAFHPAFCNRLDRNTSGIMIGGTSLAGLQKMSEIIKDRTIHKYYLAIVNGIIKDDMHISGYLCKDEKTNKVIVQKEPFKDSVFIDTIYKPVAATTDNGNLTLLAVELLTGKSHQIRAQLSSVGHPIVGDSKYGIHDINRKYNVSSQLLHAYMVRFPVMDGKFARLSEKEFHTDYPKSFAGFFDRALVKEAFNG